MLKSFNEFHQQSRVFVNEDLETDSFYSTLLDFAKSGETITIDTFKADRHSKVVKNIQLGLKSLGYDLPQSELNGILGPQTVLAIKRFKKTGGATTDKPTEKNYVLDPNKELKVVDFGTTYARY
jgi:peptidoglycan hydrolase-like protein with peptidoglycan-binding domain